MSVTNKHCLSAAVLEFSGSPQPALTRYLGGGSDGQDKGGNGGAAEVEQTPLRVQKQRVSVSTRCCEQQRLVQLQQNRVLGFEMVPLTGAEANILNVSPLHCICTKINSNPCFYTT